MIGGKKEPAPNMKRPAPGDDRRLFGYVEVDDFLLNPIFQRWMVNIALSLLLALLFSGPFSELTESAKYKVGEVAFENIFAPEDMLLKDVEATDQKRKEAMVAAPPVYDYNPEIANVIKARISKSFADFRALYQPEQDWNEAERRRMDVLRRELNQRGGRTVPYILEDNYEDREKALKATFADLLKDVSPVQFVLTDKQFAALKQDRFSPLAEAKLIELFDAVMSKGVVEKKSEPELVKGNGVTVREIKGDGSAPTEFKLADSSVISDLEEAKKKIQDAVTEQWGRDVPKGLKPTLIEIAGQLITPNYRFNSVATDERIRSAAATIEPVMVKVRKGEIIVREGEVISGEVARKLDLIGKQENENSFLAVFIGHFIWIAAFIAVLYTFPARTIRKFKPTLKDLVLLSVLMLFVLGLQRLVVDVALRFNASPEFIEEYAVPFVAGAMIIRLLINSETALIFTIGLCVLAGLMSRSAGTGLFVVLGSMLGANEVGRARSRTTIASAGLIAGLANVMIVLAFAMVGGTFFETATAYNSAAALIGGVLAGFFALALAPVIESVFGYVSDIRLLELASQEHPLLKKLILEAPGTYQHSIMVGTLVEAAAERIHVNPLLGKVMALYHDVGKMEKSHYFVENQREGMNPHDKLNPSMSTLIISSHVKYGMELGRMYRLPQVIIDAIPQHHGTRLVQYFYARAKEREDPEMDHIEEKDFRYTGPKPQSREAAILMMADSVEATARSMNDPTPARLKGMVRRIIGGIFDDGQLDECELTLKDLTAITDAFTDVLMSIYHSRPEYPTIPHSGGGKTGGPNSGGKKNGDQHPPTGHNGKGGPQRKAEDSGAPRKNTLRSPA